MTSVKNNHEPLESSDLRGTAHDYPSAFALSSRTTFCLLLVSRLLAAAYTPIQDCDEVFNFWEPTHYLNHGFGLQTWELSPEYAIRSWLYTSIHAFPIYLISWLPSMTSKISEFYFLRMALAVTCSWCETRFHGAISRSVSPRIAAIYLVATVFSAGMFHASVSYLPSSFAMYTLMLGASSCLDRGRGSKIAQGLAWFAFGAIVGWPFVAVLAIPFTLEDVLVSFGASDLAGSIGRIGLGLVGSLLILALEIGVDSFFYRQFVCVPFNIVWYNVFASGKGPDIYGTEPWHFYIRNLFINFNFWFLLACLALPLLVLQRLLGVRPASRLSLFRNFMILSPFYIWLLVFTAQPHKEERFMYPLYPFLCFNAATSLHVILMNLGGTSYSYTGIVPPWLRFLGAAASVVGFALLGIWRSAGLATAYSAPLSLLDRLEDHHSNTTPSTLPINVCVGKEWYRFPSSYHIPADARLRFIKSEFAGLLPGAFSEASSPELGFWPGTYLQPSGMNDQNLEDLGKYTLVGDCDYMIDSSLKSNRPTELEPDFIADEEYWDIVQCMPFLDAAQTHLVGRLFWLPDTGLIPRKYRRKWGEYCLLQARRK